MRLRVRSGRLVLYLSALLVSGLPRADVSPPTGVVVGNGSPAPDPRYPGLAVPDSEEIEVTRCVEDPVGDLARLRREPNYLNGYHSGRSPASLVRSPFACEPGGICERPRASLRRESPQKHRQGIARLLVGQDNYLFVSNSVAVLEDEPEWSRHPGVEVIKLSSKRGARGALGPNLSLQGPPALGDHVARYLYRPGTAAPGTGWDHAGGISTIGQYLAVPFEDSRSRGAVTRPPGIVRIYDMREPLSPRLVCEVKRQAGVGGEVSEASTAAMTRLGDGRFLLLVTGRDTRDWEMLVSRAASIGSEYDTVAHGSIDWPSYQALSFVTRCRSGANSGALYLVGTNRNDRGEDWVDLWQVSFPAGWPKPRFVKVTGRHLYCSDAATQGARYCDFRAAGGAFVDPRGRLIVYGAEHFNDGPAGVMPATTVKFREFPSF